MGEKAAEGWLVGRRIGKGGGAQGADTYMRDDPPLLTSHRQIQTQPALQMHWK